VTSFPRHKLLQLRLIPGESFRAFFTHSGLFLASALAFNLLLYFIPLSLLMVSVLGYTVLDSDRALNEVQSVLKAFLPGSQEAIAENLSMIVANRGLLGLFGFLSFLIFSTFLFGSIRTVLNRVFEVAQERPFLHGIGVDLLMMVLTAMLLLLAVGTTWFLAIAGTFAERYPSWGMFTQPGLGLLGRVIGLIVTALLLYVLYRFPPAATISPGAAIIASVIGTALFQLAKWGFTWYVAMAAETVELYGLLGGMMFLFMWLYYASAIFIFGAEVGLAYDRQRFPDNAQSDFQAQKSGN